MEKYMALDGIKSEKAPITAIASFALLKALNDSGKYKSPYQLLSNFIGYVVYDEHLHTFTLPEMRDRLQSHFGFKIPEAVIKTALKTLGFINRVNNAYQVDDSLCNDDGQFVEVQNNKETKYDEIADKIFDCIRKEHPDADRKRVVRAIVSYLVDGVGSTEYSETISAFIVANEDDKELQVFLDSVREGGILYLGINRNISEWGGLKHSLTLYLDTEILFDLTGYNGSVYKELAEDFYQLVKDGNRKGKIALRYFSEVKSEIERFFKSAEMIVEGRSLAYVEKPAMKQIVNGSRTSSDVRIKMADLFAKLRSLGVCEDDKDDYDSEDLKKYDLVPSGCCNERDMEGWEAISRVNKLRRGRVAGFELDSRYLIVSDSGNVLDASDTQYANDKKTRPANSCARYAMSLNHIVNLLWYKLDGGFGGDKFPVNAEVLLKARIVLSKIVAQKVSDIYQDSMLKYKKGEINQEQLGARILALSEKPLLPEEIQNDNCKEALDFSAETIGRLEVEIQSNRQYRLEHEKFVQAIQAENQKIIAEKTEEIKERDEIITKQQNELLVLQQKERLREKKRSKILKIVKLCLKIAFSLALFVIVYYANFKCENLNKWISGTVNAGSLIVFCVMLIDWLRSVLRKDATK